MIKNASKQVNGIWRVYKEEENLLLSLKGTNSFINLLITHQEYMYLKRLSKKKRTFIEFLFYGLSPIPPYEFIRNDYYNKKIYIHLFKGGKCDWEFE